MVDTQIELRDAVREIIEAAGGRYLGQRNNSVVIEDPQTGKRATLFLLACDPATVELTVKRLREPEPPAFEPLEAHEAL